MGEHNVQALDERQRKTFTRALLNDVRALERLLETDRIERGVRRIGAEQEMFLVDSSLHAAPVVMQVLEEANDPMLTTELAQFNIEANLDPLLFGNDCLSQMEKGLTGIIGKVRNAAAKFDADVLLVGILPTLRKSDLGLDKMTPKQRYYELNRVMCRQRGGEFHVLIKGLDQLEITHDSVMLESANTSFQIHFQVSPEEFAKLYNVAQAVTAPVLAAATNSPVLLGNRLWAETRIALFERSVDTRTSIHTARGYRPRVHFGDSWVKESILELFREDITRQRAVLSIETDDDALAIVEGGGAPHLKALRLHNGTVYRWNRPCYGVNEEGIAHLRIENRVLPAGPTVVDEVANAAFFFGLMASVVEEHQPVHELMEFDTAKRNFFAAARAGLNAQFTWLDGRTHTASNLILSHLLPLARQGLEATGINSEDVSRYLDVIQERVERERSGSQWAFDSLMSMGDSGTPNLRHRQLTASMLANQHENTPAHNWPLAKVNEEKRDRNWRSSYQTVGQIMTRDLFTVQPGDIVDLVASVMEWSHIRHVPVEDENGALIGLLSQRSLLRMIARGDSPGLVDVASIMSTDLVTVSAETRTVDALRLMREKRVSCLPVIQDDKLIGLVTERDLIVVSARLLEDFLSEE